MLASPLSNPLGGVTVSNGGVFTSRSSVLMVGRRVVTDNTAPVLLTATIDAAGTSLTLVFDEAVQAGAAGLDSGWALTTTTPGRTITNASGTGTTTLVYTISSAVFSFETATLAYTQPGTGIKNLAGINLATFSGASVTNNSTQDILAAMGFEEYWFGDNAPGHGANNSQSDWNDVGNTKTLTSADKFSYQSDLGADFNHRAGFQGDGVSRFMQWDRGSALSQTWSVTVVGAFPSGLSNYCCLAGDYSETILFPWIQKDTATPNTGMAIYEQFYTSSGDLARAYDSKPHVWTSVGGGASSKFFKDGCGQIQAVGTDGLNGLTLGRWPASAAFFGNVRIAFVAISDEDVSLNANYPAFQYWLAQYYALTAITGTHIWDMGDSRCAGTGSTNASTRAAAGYVGSGAAPVTQFGAQASMLMQSAWTGPVQTAGASYAGRTLTTQAADAPTLLEPSITASIATKKIVMTWNIGSNNYIADGAVAAYARVTSWVSYVHGLGCYCVVGTVCDYSGLTAPEETIRGDYNTAIVGNAAAADKVIDLAADPNLDYTLHPENFNDAGGGVYIHFNDLGNVVVQGDAAPILGQSPLNVT